MNTTMADGAAQRLVAQIGEALFGQPGLTLMELAEKVQQLKRAWKLVPIEPTWDMRNEGREFLIDGIEKEPELLAYFLWKTMLNAAPQVQ
ncbi:hypothetical protein [Stenotrophomonas sp.]|uniref:hypothetical protein n=1 Tax=Stenotrophomonas sp. TaxID=69392 RepID=UPI0031E013E7